DDTADPSGADEVWELNTIQWTSKKKTDWWKNNTIQYGAGLNNVDPPHFAVEYQGVVPDSLGLGSSYGSPSGKRVYHTTARATGLTDKTVVILQSTTTRRVN